MNASTATGQIDGATPVSEFLGQGLAPAQSFSPSWSGLYAEFRERGGAGRPPKRARLDGATQHVSKLRARLDKGPALGTPTRYALNGVFYPAVLLTSGLWERSDSDEASEPIKWRTPLQNWLFTGFEEWAPSWDINASSGGEASELLGQLGSEDEAFSLYVRITGAGAGNVRDELIEGGEMVRNVELTCTVLPGRGGESAHEEPRSWGKTYDYCLYVDLDGEDEIRPLEASDPYSGYLWECVSPVEWLGDKEVPELKDAFFIWEHTDFASPAAREYGLEALRQKRAYVERRFGPLELIQKSAPILPGRPRIDSGPFLALITDGRS
jgi:hypothetical protein